MCIRQRDRHREGFSWTHRQVTGHATARTGHIPDSSVSAEGTNVISDGALHGEGVVGTYDERKDLIVRVQLMDTRERQRQRRLLLEGDNSQARAEMDSVHDAVRYAQEAS